MTTVKLRELLKKAGMNDEETMEMFRMSQVDDETIALLTLESLKELGIPLGKRLKLMKLIEQQHQPSSSVEEEELTSSSFASSSSSTPQQQQQTKVIKHVAPEARIARLKQVIKSSIIKTVKSVWYTIAAIFPSVVIFLVFSPATWYIWSELTSDILTRTVHVGFLAVCIGYLVTLVVFMVWTEYMWYYWFWRSSSTTDMSAGIGGGNESQSLPTTTLYTSIPSVDDASSSSSLKTE